MLMFKVADAGMNSYCRLTTGAPPQETTAYTLYF